MTTSHIVDETFDRLRETASDPRRRVLLRGATVLTMDPSIGDYATGDILIEGATIIEVAPDLAASANDGQAIVVDLDGSIAIPGMHDTHRHSWQGQFRRLIPDADLAEYADVMHGRLGPVYRPEDMYAGNLISALGAIECGITCVLDFSHNARTSEHSDAAIDAWEDAGIRAVHASCGPLVGEWDRDWDNDLRRLRRDRLRSDDQLVTLRYGALCRVIPEISEEVALTESRLRLARELGIETSVDGAFGPVASAQFERLAAQGLLGEDMTYIHCQDLTDEAWRAIADSGGAVALAPTSDAQLGQLSSITPVQKALDLGIRPSLSVDVECCLTTDMFTQMQVVLNLQRALAYNRSFNGEANAPAPISVRDVLDFATVQGARANGLLSKCGTLSPGKQADVVIIGADAINALPLNNAVGTVVLGTDTKNVEGVLIAGQPRKWHGSLVDEDIDRVRRLVTESRDYLIKECGYELDILR